MATFPKAAARGHSGRSLMGTIMLEFTLKLKLSYKQIQFILAMLMLLF